MSNPSHKHHYVPECYLKKFTSENVLFVINITKLRKGWREVVLERSPAAICYAENYYLMPPVEKPDGLSFNAPHALYLEVDVFQQFEKKYDSIYQQVIKEQQLPVATAVFVCNFLVQMKMRNPYHFRENVEKNKSQSLQMAIKMIMESEETNELFGHMDPSAKELVKQLVFDEHNNNPETARKMFLNSLAIRHENPERNKIYQDILLKANWRLFIAPADGPYFITTDNPGMAVDNDNKIHNTKFRNGFAFMFPLSKQYCLAIDDVSIDEAIISGGDTKYITRVPATPEAVNSINTYMIQKINDLIIGADRAYIQQLADLNRPVNK